jgi:large subunit ribosomal protein L13e
VKSWFDQPANKKRRTQARQAKAAAVFPRPVEKLRPLVNGMTRRYSSKIRYGRGFSLQELSKAKISPAFARTVGIAVDHRRHDASEEKLQLNVQRLESYKSKLILFPRRADKPKKGDIADSTADKLKSAAAGNQNTSKHVVEKPRRKVRQTPAKITKEMTATKVFRKLRQLKVNEKYKGKREKKAKDDAAKEK